ncbi:MULTISPECIES: sulfite dehydrogenase [Nitrospira]|uniref:Sulfite dehydrogenase n=2 Tax=Nitrospira TaxID=1234 RepID=A0AA86MZ45_9BACT|nr:MULTISPECIES: sulfite dehydrogenase [Nitrospira]CAE6731677.1 Sulfite dehydrogenase [Nitrospira defluvii]CAI4031736.1 Sulfite dehydrogenase [Nitrospira tepida]
MSSPDQTKPVFSEREPPEEDTVDRRAWLVSAVSSIGTTAASLIAPSLLPAEELAALDPTAVPGHAPSPYGSRAPGETAHRLPTATHSLTPHHALHGIITPSALHFERHHNGVPSINPDRHRLLIHGLVDRPLTFSMNDLTRFPSITRTLFIECSGNSGKEWKGPTGTTVQETHGLMSTSEWTGVPLSTVLAEAGIKPDAAWVLAEGSDAAAMTRSLPLAAVVKDALLCYAQNGEALRPEQGYPLRLVIPGWEGNTCIKWVRRLKLGTAPFMTREETSRYTDLMPDGTARQFTFVMEAKSVITSPSGGQQITPGFVEIRGLAWSGRGKIAKVEVSADGGLTWRTAQLQEPVLPYCHTRFRYGWRWHGDEAIIQSRCIDETGYIQPSRAALITVRGTNSVYHYNAIQSWKVGGDGKVTNVEM